MKAKANMPDTKDVEALLEVLRTKGVKSYEFSAEGTTRVEFYPPSLVEGRRPIYAPAPPSEAPEAVEAPMRPTGEPSPLDPAGPPGIFANVRRDDPLFRHIDVSKVNP